jgi:hypothetical protein
MKSVLLFLVAAAVCGQAAHADAKADTLRDLLALERQAMDGWRSGNPDPTLDAADPEITYFHVMTTKRLNGLTEVKSLVEPYRGTSLFDSYEIVEPQVQLAGPVAVLTYCLVQHKGETTYRWNATQVYERKPAGWRVIHSHWSQVRPPQQ